MGYDDLLDHVREEAGLDDRQQAGQVLDATLATLAERLTGGEVDDLAEQLPDEAAAALRANRQHDATNTPFGLDELCRRVANRQRGAVSPPETRTHVRAVFSALHQAAPEELRNVRAQLPREYEEVL